MLHGSRAGSLHLLFSVQCLWVLSKCLAKELMKGLSFLG